MREVAANFEASPKFGPLPDKYVKKVVDILPIDLPLELAGTVSARMARQARLACAQMDVVLCLGVRPSMRVPDCHAWDAAVLVLCSI